MTITIHINFAVLHMRPLPFTLILQFCTCTINCSPFHSVGGVYTRCTEPSLILFYSYSSCRVGFLVIILYRSNILSPDTPTQKYLWMYVHDRVRNNRNLFRKCSSHGFASGYEAIILQACSSELLFKTLLPWTVFDIAIMTRCPISQLQRADAVEHWHLGAI